MDNFNLNNSNYKKLNNFNYKLGNFEERFIERNIAELAEEYDKIHGANINLARITPELIDGLKPVQRRTLYVMSLKDKGKVYRKVAAIDGDVISKVHPHGPTSVYDALVNVAQWWNNSIPLIDPFGNFGNVSGDDAGADRYISARLSEYSQACFFEDWADSVVDSTISSVDDETKDPLYLPAKYPNILLNGTIGIGYGIGTSIPPFNFREVIKACYVLINNPDANIILIPDSPTGCDIIESDFAKISNTGSGKYMMRCKYEIDPEHNNITITALPYLISSNQVRQKIADIKEKNGLPELVDMSDKSGKFVELILHIRDDVNPYKFMKKLIKEVDGLEKTYPVNINVVNDYEVIDYSIKRLLLEWLDWDREQKRTIISNKRIRLMSEQRENDVKIFIMEGDNLDRTINIFRTSRNRAEVERRLIETYRNTPIRMDSLQARALSKMQFVELCEETYEKCLEERERIIEDLKEVDIILHTKDGINKLIIGELRDGDKRFGSPRKSNVVPYKISIDSVIEGSCILQLSSDGTIVRKQATNVDDEAIPVDNNGFAVHVDNDSGFILIDDNGYHSFIRVKDIPVDVEVPVNRFSKQKIDGNIIAMLPIDIESDRCCTLISRMGMLKKIRIADMAPSKKPCIVLDKGDKLVRGIITKARSQKDILVYTKNGMGQRLDPNNIRITSPNAKGGNGFKLKGDDEIIGCYVISPEDNQYLLYVTSKGKMRLNAIEYLPIRDSKHDAMLSLINLNDRDKLVSVVGCNKLDKVEVFFDNATSEKINLAKLEESTMSSDPKKITVTQNAVTTNIVKVKLL